MTNSPIRDEEPRDIDSASIDELEKMLADAESSIHAIRAELAERRAEQGRREGRLDRQRSPRPSLSEERRERQRRQGPL